MVRPSGKGTCTRGSQATICDLFCYTATTDNFPALENQYRNTGCPQVRSGRQPIMSRAYYNHIVVLALHCEKQPSASTVDTEQLIFIV
jgi:hypothetical protein